MYAEARAVMADELGIEPGEALQRIEAAILLEDPARDPDLGNHPMPRDAARLPVPRTPTYGRDELVAGSSGASTTPRPGWSPSPGSAAAARRASRRSQPPGCATRPDGRCTSTR